MPNGTEIRPFRVDVPAGEVAELRRRIAVTRWPERETVADESAGRATRDDAGTRALRVLGESAPRSWAEQAYPDLIYFNEVDKGGHFAAWERPDLSATEIRAAFRSLR